MQREAFPIILSIRKVPSSKLALLKWPTVRPFGFLRLTMRRLSFYIYIFTLLRMAHQIHKFLIPVHQSLALKRKARQFSRNRSCNTRRVCCFDSSTTFAFL